MATRSTGATTAGADVEDEVGRGTVQSAEAATTNEDVQTAPRTASGDDVVVWKDGRKKRVRILGKGDGKGPQHPTGFTKRYVFSPENNWTVEDMEPGDKEFLQTLVDAVEFRFDPKVVD